MSAKIDCRLASTGDRKDVFSYILPLNDEKGMSLLEMRVKSATVIGAGTGTTNTWLSTTVHDLTCNLDAYHELAEEIRGTLANEEEITSERATQLPYLVAVVQESLRMHSPSPSSLGRRCWEAMTGARIGWLCCQCSAGGPRRTVASHYDISVLTARVWAGSFLWQAEVLDVVVSVSFYHVSLTARIRK